jgi:tetratricopeptide (TPR) repeat protein
MRLWSIFVVAFAVALAGHTAGAAAATVAPGDATVILLSRDIDGSSCGNGVVIGDGTLIVTARSVIFPRRNAGLHQGDPLVTALSPYLGQAAEVQVLAQDRESDLVLLRATCFAAHPAMQLAGDDELVAAEKLEISGFGKELSAVAGGGQRLVDAVPRVASATLDVNAVLVRRGETRAINTTAPPSASGWAGGPVVVPATNHLAGCYLRTQGDGVAGSSSSAGAIRRLVEQARASARLTATPTPLVRPARADDSSLEYLRAVAASASANPTEALAHWQAFVTMRPTSAVAYREMAGQLRSLNRMNEAQIAYATALELEPAMVSARVLYGQLLHERILPKAAEEHLTYAWQHGDGSTAAVIPLCNLLREQGRELECLPILAEAVRRRPDDAHLWNYLGQSKRATNDHAGAAVAFARAADLMPENPLARASAADAFVSAGQRTQAEQQYRLLVSQHARSAAAHFDYARFLARDRSRRSDALAQAQEAMELRDAPGAPPRDVIESLIDAIRAGRTGAIELRL